MESIVETIKKRCSVRTYGNVPVEPSKLQHLSDYCASNTKGPLGSNLRFQIVDASGDDKSDMGKLGTYGVIKGTRLFIAGAVKKGNRAMEDFGYCMEKNILKATALGLGTVWLGGTFNRSGFAARISVLPDELIPAVTPIGYPADRRSAVDMLFRLASGSKNRKSFEEIFFVNDPKTPLDKENCGEYHIPLESVRLAPSASNKQPWRVVKEKEKNVFHFYLKENAQYNSKYNDIKLQNVDMGIAMCHFELSARELGKQGSWLVAKPESDAGELLYIASWVERQ